MQKSLKSIRGHDPDHLNTPRLIADSTGTTVWRWDQGEPFGNDVPNDDPNSTGNHFDFPLRFAGQYFDRETNLHYNYFRDYDPSLGIYKQSDPIGLRGGLNPCAYAAGNPLVFVDPNGDSIIQIVAIAVTAYGFYRIGMALTAA